MQSAGVDAQIIGPVSERGMESASFKLRTSDEELDLKERLRRQPSRAGRMCDDL
jgi:hypothetical protein